jgi:hypothetical protein
MEWNRPRNRTEDPPVKGSFHSSVGNLYADDTESGKRIRIQFIWSEITATS